ncbi:MAG TPA: hypothetical protein PLI27_00830 [Ignavibacteriales bacterium]|nr:hypothetical protein [Ignavibacteriales bacterium]HRR17612.1 hypothetical protein [Ignavibacteriales bacterium]HRT98102.1 hypothetical protein [Ignavibacteriales bacterium]
MYVGSGIYGLFKLNQNSNKFEHTGLPVGTVYNIAFWKESIIYTATKLGIQMKNLKTGKWSSVSNSIINDIAVTPNGTVYAATNSAGLLKSTNNGKYWNALYHTTPPKKY